VNFVPFLFIIINLPITSGKYNRIIVCNINENCINFFVVTLFQPEHVILYFVHHSKLLLYIFQTTPQQTINKQYKLKISVKLNSE